MATYGWIREDDLDAFYEGTEKVLEPGLHKPTFTCPFCVSVFNDRRELQIHISGMHQVERPVILVKGKEPNAHSIVRVPLRKADFVVTNATSATVSQNGSDPSPISLADLVGKILDIRDGELKVLLANETEPNASPVLTTYTFAMRVADSHILRNVELAFAQILMSKPISRELIGRFLADERSVGAGQEYANGLAEYSLGILLKERPDTENLTTSFSRYREVYGSALERLSDFDRPLAVLICHAIRFAMNDFGRSSKGSGFWELDLANALLNDPGSLRVPLKADGEIARKPICPIDHGTARILDLAVRMIQQTRWSPILDEECREVSNSDAISGADREKALAIWGANAFRLNAFLSATEPLKRISAIYPFSRWAESYLERTET